MRVVLQRVSEASVRIDGRTVATIGRGLLLLVGFTRGDGEPEVDWIARKVLGLRVFSDSEGRMNLPAEEVGAEILVVSQFTLYGDTAKGRRPSFAQAADPAEAEPLYGRFIERLEELSDLKIEGGRFGAMMDVSLVNDGPVTLVLERESR